MPHHGGACYYEDIKDAHFSYDEETCRRPEQWCCLHKCWTTCGSTRRQSPINLDTSRARRTNANLKLYNIDKRANASIHNSGHAPHFDVDEKSKDITLKLKNIDDNGTRSKDTYIFKDLHIHLGKKEKKGSEHSIDGKFYPMEAHMVFYNSNYENITVAKPNDDGLVVIGVMIQVNKKYGDDNDDEDDDEDDGDDNTDNENRDDNEDDKDDEYERGDDKERSKRETKSCCHSNYGDYKYRKHDEEYFSNKCYEGKGKCKVRFARRLSCLMEKYYEEIKEYHEQGDTANETHEPRCENCGEKPDDSLIQNVCKRPGEKHDSTIIECGISPADVLPYDQRFYTYPGSLTTPPCYESVQWIVYKCPIKVSRRAFKALQRVEDAEKKPLKEHGVRRPLQKNEYKVSKNF